MAEEETPNGGRFSRSNRGKTKHADDYVYYEEEKHKKLPKEPKTPKSLNTVPKTPKTPSNRTRTAKVVKSEVKSEPNVAEKRSKAETTTPPLNTSSRGADLHFETSVVPKVLTQEEEEELRNIEKNLTQGKKGFKRRGRPTENDYAEHKENMMKIQILKEQGHFEKDVTTPVIRPPPAKKPRRSPPTAPPAPMPIIVMPPDSTPLTRKIALSKMPRISPQTATPMPEVATNGYRPDVKVSYAGQLIPPRIVAPLTTEPSSARKNPLLFVKRFTRPTIRFLKPHVQSINPRPQASSEAAKISALKEALHIRREALHVRRPVSAASTTSNGSQIEKENIRKPLQVQTNSSPVYRMQAVEPPQPDSPSIITFANYPNNLLSFEPNVKYCLVNQNGQLVYPDSELVESSSEIQPSPSPSTQKFFEPRPNYFLAVL